jgi:hypothetical protein
MKYDPENHNLPDYQKELKLNFLEKYLLSSSLSIMLLFFLCFISLHNIYAQASELFESDEVLEFTLKFDYKALNKDRGDDPKYHQATIEYQEGDTSFEIPLKIKARGNFRKMPSNCGKYPPIFLNFKKSVTPKNSIFKDQDKTKLVTPCRGDNFVINEYLVYKLYDLVSPMSFRARLVKVTYHDNVKDKSSEPLFSVLLEEKKQLKKRFDAKTIEKKGYKPVGTSKKEYMTMAVFQYLIGNTDWSIQYQHNIVLFINDSTSLPITIPFDFDHAGIVQAPYANPAEELQMSSTRERRYRGYCMKNLDEFQPIFEKFNQLKEDFYAIYEDDELLSDGYKKQTIKFLDDFYETINDPKRTRKEFISEPCDPNSTNNIIIKGLNAD